MQSVSISEEQEKPAAALPIHPVDLAWLVSVKDASNDGLNILSPGTKRLFGTR